MSKNGESAQTARELSSSERTEAIEAWEAERAQDLEKIKAELLSRRRAEHREDFFRNIRELWPMWVGLLLGVLAPQIKLVVESFGQWCMELVYPYVVLAQRPEVQIGHISSMIPGVLMYAQFPLEGLFAYFVLRHTVRPFEVALEVALLHGLGIAELWMLTGVPFFLVRH